MAKGNKIGCCPSVGMVEFSGMAEPSVGHIELGQPSDETSRRVVESRDTGRVLRGDHVVCELHTKDGRV